MQQDDVCPSCKVKIASDLTNCPLCGKHIRDKEATKSNKRTFPLYDTKFVQQMRWYNIIRAFFWLAGTICVFINLIFPTKPYWCVYVLSALVMVFYVFINPIKVNVSSYIKSLSIMSIFIGLFLIFIDAFNHFNFHIAFGWSISYAAPFVMLASVIASAIICLSSRRYERELLKSVVLMAVYSVIFFVVEICCFSNLSTWAGMVLMCSSLGLMAVIEMFRRHKLLRELSIEFHI